METVTLIAAGFASYRLARLLVADVITRRLRWWIAVRLRGRRGLGWVVDGPLGCMACSTVWTALFVASVTALWTRVGGPAGFMLLWWGAAGVAWLAAVWAGDMPDLPDDEGDGDGVGV